jgi:hypothetical protein
MRGSQDTSELPQDAPDGARGARKRDVAPATPGHEGGSRESLSALASVGGSQAGVRESPPSVGRYEDGPGDRECDGPASARATSSDHLGERLVVA